jgi:hypothetical protein
VCGLWIGEYDHVVFMLPPPIAAIVYQRLEPVHFEITVQQANPR